VAHGFKLFGRQLTFVYHPDVRASVTWRIDPLHMCVSPSRDAMIGREGHWQSRVLRNDMD
jgi:hypothetical protein